MREFEDEGFMRINNIKTYFIFVLSLLFLLLSLGGVFALVSIQPASTQVNACPDANVAVNVSLSNVANVYGLQFDLRYNQSILNLSSIAEGGLLSNNGQYSVYLNYTASPGLIRNFIITRQGSVGGTSTTGGVIAKIIFRLRSLSIYPATSNLALSNVKVSNMNGTHLNNSTQSGSVTVNACPCTNGQTQACTASNGCAGIRTCSNGQWGVCVATQNRCDINCDGANDTCVSGSCPTCECIGYNSRDCTTSIGNCPGIQNCSGGHWGVCIIRGYYCDNNCDGTNDTCSLTACAVCNCITGQVRSCTAGNGCSGSQSCSGGAWSSCTSSQFFCDANCDSVNDTCSDSPCVICACITGQSRSCTASNSCSGTQTCSGGMWGSCATGLNYCDVNCNGTSVCTSGSCPTCQCTGSATRSCTTPVGCAGTQRCSGGAWGSCTITGFYCDANCNGTSICTSSACPTCQCTGSGSRSCTTSNGCVGSQICSGGVLGSCISSQYYCDNNCDGTNDTCRNASCQVCNCLSGTSKGCLTSDGCTGTQSCVNGNWGACASSQFFCDMNCDGTKECSDANCSACCIEDWDCDEWSTCSDRAQTRSCSDLNACGTNKNKPSESRTCFDGSSRDSSGSSSGGGALPSCVESWTCQIWGACDADGFRRRTCADVNNCGTSSAKPKELETCLYEGNCQDGIMNGDEQNIDCGGRCSNPCSGEIIANLPQLNVLSVSTLDGEILDNYALEINVENLGENEVIDLYVATNKWSEESVHIGSLLPGMTEKRTILLNLPGDPYENSLEIQVSQNNNLVSTKSIPVTLSVPLFNVKLGRDPETGKVYQALVIDNRNNPARHVEVDFSVSKNKDTYLIETDKPYDVGENELFHHVDYLYQNLPSGEYEVDSVLYEQGQKVDEATSHVVLGGENEGFNVKYLFYFLIVILVGISVYVFFMSQKKSKG